MLLDRLLGRPLSDAEEEHECIGPLTGVPVLGLDALASAAYGPEAALTLLLPQLELDNPDRDIAVVIPELVMNRWYEGLLHNNRGALLRMRCSSRVVVVSTTYHLRPSALLAR